MHNIYYIGYEDITLELNELFITDWSPVVRWDDLLWYGILVTKHKRVIKIIKGTREGIQYGMEFF